VSADNRSDRETRRGSYASTDQSATCAQRADFWLTSTLATKSAKKPLHSHRSLATLIRIRRF
jgi:hypothetical protein